MIDKLFNIDINMLRNPLLNKPFSLLFYHADTVWRKLLSGEVKRDFLRSANEDKVRKDSS